METPESLMVHDISAGLTSGAIRQPFPPRSTFQLVKGNCRPMRSSARQQPKSEITSQGQPSGEGTEEVSDCFSSFPPRGPPRNPLKPPSRHGGEGLTGVGTGQQRALREPNGKASYTNTEMPLENEGSLTKPSNKELDKSLDQSRLASVLSG